MNNFKNILKKVKQPRKIMPETKLPYVFDLYWDAKTGRDLQALKNNPEVGRFLAEHGFDVKKWKEEA